MLLLSSWVYFDYCTPLRFVCVCVYAGGIREFRTYSKLSLRTILALFGIKVTPVAPYGIGSHLRATFANPTRHTRQDQVCSPGARLGATSLVTEQIGVLVTLRWGPEAQIDTSHYTSISVFIDFVREKSIWIFSLETRWPRTCERRRTEQTDTKSQVSLYMASIASMWNGRVLKFVPRMHLHNMW